MLKQLFFACLLFSVLQPVNAQKNSIRLLVAGGHSFNGSGDLQGYAVLNQVDVPLSKRFYLSPGFYYSNHTYSASSQFFEIRGVNSGFNLFTNINYAILSKKKHQLLIGAGPVLRFQTSSVPDVFGQEMDANGQPQIILEYDKQMKRASFGYNISPAYSYQLNKRISIGAKFILQNDTNADLIRSTMLTFGIKL